MSYTPRRPAPTEQTTAAAGNPGPPGLVTTLIACLVGAAVGQHGAAQVGLPRLAGAGVAAALVFVLLYADVLDGEAPASGGRPKDKARRWVSWRVLVLHPRHYWHYGRKWEPIMTMCAATVDYRGRRYMPKLLRVERHPHMDRLFVKLTYGQKPADLMAAVDELGHSYKRRAARVRSDPKRPGHATIDMVRIDLLVNPVPIVLADPDADVDLAALTLGMLEDGRAWLARIIGSHWLVAGRTGAGKGSVLWSLILATGPFIRRGLVQWWVIDPKGGMEFGGPGEKLYHRFAAGDYETQAQLLRDAVAVMRQRAARLAGKTRKHQPGPGSPLIIVMIDELAALIAYSNGPRPIRWEMIANLNLLLSQGRAVGVVVVAALQDPRKAVLESRELFPNKVALGLDDADMVLGKGAEAKGARVRDIDKPGELYVWVDGEREPVRGRAFMVTDDDIRRGAELYAPLPVARQRELVGTPGAPVIYDEAPDVHPDLVQILDVPWVVGPDVLTEQEAPWDPSDMN